MIKAASCGLHVRAARKCPHGQCGSALQAVRRINHLGRLIEYRQAKSRVPRQEAATEHVAILNLIAKKQNRRAANLLRAHLEAARHNKVSNLEVFG